MKAYVGVTDTDWYERLAALPDIDEVNFWQPGGRTRFRALEPSELFVFKLHSPHPRHFHDDVSSSIITIAEGTPMTDDVRDKYLSLALKIIGLIYIFGIFALMQLMTPSWSWEPRQPEYEQMIVGVYATLGVFLFLAAKEPQKHASLIWFTIWSNIVHAAIMLVQALRDPVEVPNLYGDVPALFILAAVLWYLMPKAQSAA